MNRDSLMKKRDEIRSKNQGGSGDFWKSKDGDNHIRILPYHDKKSEDGAFWFEETALHYRLGDTGKVAVDCPARVAGSQCPICEGVETLKQAGDKDSLALAHELRPNPSYYCLILDKDDPQKAHTIQVWPAPSSAVQQLLDYDCDPAWGEGLAHAETGRIVTVTKTPKSASNPFVKYTCRPSPALDPLDPEILEQIEGKDLSRLIKLRSVEALTHLMNGGSVEEADAMDSQAEPAVEEQPVEEAPVDETVTEEAQPEPAPEPEPAPKPAPRVVRPVTRAPVAAPAAPIVPRPQVARPVATAVARPAAKPVIPVVPKPAVVVAKPAVASTPIPSQDAIRAGIKNLLAGKKAAAGKDPNRPF